MKTNKNLNKIQPSGPYSYWKPGIQPLKKPDFYVITVLECLGKNWSDWFHGLEINCNETESITQITGKIQDQSELYSILNKIQNLGLTLIDVKSN